jgi:hypothetical protein
MGPWLKLSKRTAEGPLSRLHPDKVKVSNTYLTHYFQKPSCN